MKEPPKAKYGRINPFTGEDDGAVAGFKGFVSFKDEVFFLEKNLFDIKYVYVVNQLVPSNEDAQCADGGWFYVWSFEPGSNVYYVPKGASDKFDALEAADHIKIGELAFGKPGNKLALLITISEDAILILKRLGHLYDLDTLEWSYYESD